MNEEVEAKKVELARVCEQIQDLVLRRDILQREIYEMQSPFKVGDLIQWKDCWTHRRGRVEAILPDRVAWVVRRVKMNGLPAMNTDVIYPAYAPTKVAEAQGQTVQ